MLGQPLSMLIPQVVGFRLHGKLREGSTATDLVLVVTQMLRKTGVVGKLVEFFGPGVAALPVADRGDHRQHGARVRRHLRHLPDRRRDAALPALLGARARSGGAGRGLRARAGDVPRRRAPRRRSYTDVADLDLGVGRAERGRAEAPAGSRQPLPDQEVVRGGAAEPDQAEEEGGLGLDPGQASPASRPTSASRRQRPSRPSSSTARWSSPPSPAAPTPRTRGDGGGRPGGQEGGRKGAPDPALGQDLAGARLEGGHRVPGRGGADAVPREARLPHRRLRLHHLHRQLGAAAAAGRRRHRGARPGRRQRALRQPQLRGAHQPRRARQLPDVAAAGGGLRAGRPDRHRPRQGAARRGDGRAAGLPARRLAVEQRGCRRRRQGGQAGDVREARTAWCSRATSAGASSTCRSATPTLFDGASTYIKHPPYFEGMAKKAGAARRPRRARACWRSSATASRPTTSRPPAASRRTARPASTWSPTASTPRTSTATAPAAATTR